MADRRRTSTSDFGTGRRESHDASDFYRRFEAPKISSDDVVADAAEVAQPFLCGDSRSVPSIADASVALVVTSPPYFAGKQYENEIERDGVPASYLEYLEMLHAVFAECVRVLEPGGRIAINVANLGRRPYRSLAADVTYILQDRLGLLLRGEIVWRKGAGASGSCAWGSFRQPSNPVLRDLTERVIIASKGQFQRALTPAKRKARGLPHVSSISAEDFMTDTLDLWTVPTESARRVGHPAPFPVELPARLIELLTYENDLVYDPFMGSGSTLVAASQTRRRFVGVDLDPKYVALAESRVRKEGSPVDLVWGGESGKELVRTTLEDAGFTVEEDRRIPGTGLNVTVATSGKRRFVVETGGPFVRDRPGLLNGDALWRLLGRMSVLSGVGERVLVLTAATPLRRSEGDLALRSVGATICHDVINVFDVDDRERLRQHANGHGELLPGFWNASDIA